MTDKPWLPPLVRPSSFDGTDSLAAYRADLEERLSDRELLDAAAKAAGLWDSANDCIDVPWSPLTDDGDALRLAVKLGLELTLWPTAVMATKGGRTCQQVSVGNDRCAATRRAIVLAAAALAGHFQV